MKIVTKICIVFIIIYILILLNFDFSLYLLKRYHIENYKVL